MRKKLAQLVSALPPLAPISIIDAKTGEYVAASILQEKFELISDLVLTETERLYSAHKANLLEALEGYRGTPPAAEFARQKGYKTSFNETLPKIVKAKSRMEKLVQFKLVSEISSYVENTDSNKKEPAFSKTINLSAVDKQMASLSQDGSELNLLWSCWDAKYYITFQIPKYVLKRNIDKFSLPLVKQHKKTGKLEFIFAVIENCQNRKGHAQTVGIDLGKVIPYSMAVVNKFGSRVASYEPSPRLTQLSRKRELLIIEQKHIQAKIRNRATRGLSSPSQEIEVSRTISKITRLTKTLSQQMGSEIAHKLSKHNSNLIKVENLSWVSGHRKAKIGSSRWSHSQQQDAIIHATMRKGYKTKKVSAYNTSQSCNKCQTKIAHRKNRTVWCSECKTKLDRDFNAAMNIAKSNFPVSKKLNGDITGNSDVTQFTGKEASQENLSLFCPPLSR